MRIIAGNLRGRWLNTRGTNPGVKPISGRIKQSLFDIIKELVPDCSFLDLFAGTGAVGVEALSRGAKTVFFVDRDRDCVDMITKNLEKAGLTARAKAHPGNILGDLSWIVFRSGLSQFDIIFMGPPYKDLQKKPLAYTNPTVLRILEAKLLAPAGWLVCQHHVREEVGTPPGLVMVRRAQYGDSFLTFFRHAPAA